MISVVIPLYNKESFIAETVQSALNQSFTDFELIIVNDGSTDTSVSTVNQFKDDRIIVESIANSGVSVARNSGVQKAKFPWIAFLDGDDWWHPDFLQNIITAIKVNPEQRIFATGRSRVFKSKVERYHNSVLPKPGTTGVINYFEVLALDLPPINSSNAVIDKKLLIEKGLFKEGMKQHEDHDLWIRVCEENEVVFINEALSFYRKTEEDSASQKIFTAKDFSTYVTSILKVNEALSGVEHQFFKRYCQKFVCIRYFQNVYHYTRHERKMLYSLFKKLDMSGNYKVLLWGIHQFAFLNLFGFHKKLKN